MKPLCHITFALVVLLFATACERKPAAIPHSPGIDENVRFADIPLLPATKGDRWVYKAKLSIPAGVTSPGSAEVNTSHERIRRFIGKIKVVEEHPPVDCFELITPGAPIEREFVEIHEDKILMRGSQIIRSEPTKPMWLAQPIPFVMAGMKPGTLLPEFQTSDGALHRRTEVTAREEITVPAGSFPCIRLLTTGSDGDLELRRTTWFSPGKGIIRQEKVRYRQERLIFRETLELTEIQMAKNSFGENKD